METRSREKSGFYYIYVFQLKGTDYYKIGLTDHIKKRLCSVNTSNPTEVICIKYYRVATSRDANTLEGLLHRLFADKRLYNAVTKRPKEWFTLTNQDLSVIEYKCLRYNCQIKPEIPSKLAEAFQYAEFLKRKYIN